MMDCGNCGYWKFVRIGYIYTKPVSIGECGNSQSEYYALPTPYFTVRPDGQRLSCWRPEGGQKEPVYGG